MAHYTFSKRFRTILIIAGVFFIIIAIAIFIGWMDLSLSDLISKISGRQPKPSWPGYFRQGGFFLLMVGILLLLGEYLLNGFHRVANLGVVWLEKMDIWRREKTKTLLNDTDDNLSERTLTYNRWDALILLLFVFVAFVYQLSVMSPGYPTVLLGGDAANIASFAAGRAFPGLFTDDAILGNLDNIGLYVTIHLPIAIWLEKIVGNFGLAYSLLLFPHVILQYSSYYLLGRVLFHHRYWALLFSLANSAPLVLDGGEMWGVAADAMPRITFQVLIPFILILLLSKWRKKPDRWPWVMVIVGLMAFIHPVSTPVWAFALWLGFWIMFPGDWDIRHKIFEMFKLGVILAIALLPYVSIYLTYHHGGSGMSNYDLVYYILNEYFPKNLLNIPGAVNTLLQNSAQSGLLWFGMGGLIVTFLLFNGERPRLKQLLVWMTGIVFVSILIPWIEIEVERYLRLIPLQTELMRGMRYLVLFLFIFWFYPFAELTRRSAKTGFTRTVFVAGTLVTFGFLVLNPPRSFTGWTSVMDCWQNGKIVCPTDMDFADALTYVREETPEGSKFTVFLTNRWSGIEVRYLGLRPMVYAYKDKGQLAFTNIEALEQWNTYQQMENKVFSNRLSPTLDDKRRRMVEFARDVGADYLLTNFPFPPEVQDRLNVEAAYQNATFSVLDVFAGNP